MGAEGEDAILGLPNMGTTFCCCFKEGIRHLQNKQTINARVKKTKRSRGNILDTQNKGPKIKKPLKKVMERTVGRVLIL